MSRRDLLDSINSDLSNLTNKKERNQGLRSFGGFGVKCGMIAAGLGLLVQFAINKLYDREPYNHVKEQLDAGTLIVPKSEYKEEQANCVRERLIETSPELKELYEDWPQSSFIDLVDENEGAFKECANEVFQKNEDIQEDYLESFERSNIGYVIAFSTVLASVGYLFVWGAGAGATARTANQMRKRQRDRDLLSLD